MLFLHRLSDYQQCWSMFGIPKYVPDALLEANFQILGSVLVRKKNPQVTSLFSHNHKKCQFKAQSCVVGFKSTFARATCFRLDSCRHDMPN